MYISLYITEILEFLKFFSLSFLFYNAVIFSETSELHAHLFCKFQVLIIKQFKKLRVSRDKYNLYTFESI